MRPDHTCNERRQPDRHGAGKKSRDRHETDDDTWITPAAVRRTWTAPPPIRHRPSLLLDRGGPPVPHPPPGPTIGRHPGAPLGVDRRGTSAGRGGVGTTLALLGHTPDRQRRDEIPRDSIDPRHPQRPLDRRTFRVARERSVGDGLRATVTLRATRGCLLRAP